MKQLEMISESNIQISRNCVVLNILNRDLMQLNHSMNTVEESLKALEFSKNFLLAMLQVRNRLAIIHDGMDNLKIDLMEIHQYMTGLPTHKVSPTHIPPADQQGILLDVKNKLKTNPKSALPVSEKADIWSYYQLRYANCHSHFASD